MARIRYWALAATLVALMVGTSTASAQSADPVIAGAGDIACDPTGASFNNGDGDALRCRQRYTSDLLVGQGLAAVLALGDTQYEDGTLDQFRASYDLSWGRVKSITRPAIGNHEYRLSPGTGYFDYFNGVGSATGPAGDRGRGYYSFDVNGWHLIALNSMCDQVPGGCGVGSAQEQWLRSDLAANSGAACTLAYWHHPLFNSGPDGTYKDTPWNTTALWQALYDAGAELVLSGHAHIYQRFGPQDAGGNADPQRGLREFVVGTGGKSLGNFGPTQPNLEFRDNTQYGVIKLVLHPNSYDWTFVNEAAQIVDLGSAGCHGAPSDVTPPQTTITSGPSGSVKTTSVTFAFASSESGSTFECKFDSGAFTSCTSPKTYSGLAAGGHTFQARATDTSGNTDPTPATRSFKVVGPKRNSSGSAR
jgi:calcineurin-like phosphoesterase family protein